MNKQNIAEILSKHLEIQPSHMESQAIGGGCINYALKISSNLGEYFLKWNQHDHTMFEAEAKGLKILSETHTLSIPSVLGFGAIENKSYLLLEFIPGNSGSKQYWENFGEKLADLHRHIAKEYGLDHDNFIGRLNQSNTQNADWIDFFINSRIQPQLQMAKDQGLIDQGILKKFEILLSKLEVLIPYEPPSCLHGDLWSGNIMCGPDHQPFVIDPAVYFGHREIELAFTHLFGGFDNSFYQAYDHNYPRQPGYEDRVDIFNLYPLLVHVNLFGASYLSGIRQTLKKFT